MHEDTYNQDQRPLTIWSDLNTAAEKAQFEGGQIFTTDRMGAMADMAIFMALTCTFWVPVVTSIHLTEKGRNSIYCDIYN